MKVDITYDTAGLVNLIDIAVYGATASYWSYIRLGASLRTGHDYFHQPSAASAAPGRAVRSFLTSQRATRTNTSEHPSQFFVSVSVYWSLDLHVDLDAIHLRSDNLELRWA